MFGVFARQEAGPLAPLSIRSTRSVEVEDVSSALTAAEYASVRAESLQSFATSQSIIQWSLATYGVLFGAGLLAASNQIASDLTSAVAWMAALIYGILLPGLVSAAAWSWIGEIRRMERSGVYMRGVERRFRIETQTSSSSVVSPLNWESFLTGDVGSGAPGVKGFAPYLGTAMLFGGAQLSSVVFFYIWIDRLFDQKGSTFAIWTLVLTDTGLIAGFLVVCLHSGLGVVQLGNRYFNLESLTLQWIREPRWSFKKFEFGSHIVVGVIGAGLYLLLLPDRILPWRDALFAWTGWY